MTTDVQNYRNELLFALRMRDVPGPRIAEALAEVDSHVTETGENPREAFGPPKAYADELTAALGAPRGKTMWRTVFSRATAAYALGGAVGTWLLLDGAIAASIDADSVLGLPAVVALAIGVCVLVATAVSLVALSRREDTRVLDPRTGLDMIPPRPAWALPLMLSPLLLALVLAVVVAVAQR